MLCISMGFAQLESPQGRWLVQAITDSGKVIPLLILQIHTDSETSRTEILSTSAPFGLIVRQLNLDQNMFELDLGSGQGNLRFRGSFSGDSIEGIIEGFVFDGFRFHATPTELERLKPFVEATQEAVQGYRRAMGIKDPNERIEAFDILMQSHPGSPVRWQAAVQRFKGLVETGRSTEELLTAAEDTLQLSDDKLTAINDMAYALAKENRLLERAETYAREAVGGARANSSTHGNFLHTLGWVLFQKGQIQAAAEHLKRAYALASDKRELVLHLAQVLEVLGDTRQARQFYLKSYARDAHLGALNKALELHLREQGSPEELHELMDREYESLIPEMEVGEYQGKPGKKIVVAELFTGAACNPCQGADYAFHGLRKYYPDTVVTILKYHLHVPGPDPMTNPDAEDRASYYAVRGTPEVIIEGVDRRSGGGFSSAAPSMFLRYQEMIEQHLNAKSPLSLKLEGTLQDDFVQVKVSIDLIDPQPTDQLRLRIALVEGSVHYTGFNRVHFHEQVVRKLFGGANGLALSLNEEGSGKFELKQNVSEIEADLEGYLKSYQEKWGYAFKALPFTIDRGNLSVLAFVQNDRDKHILNAASVRLE